MATLDEKIKYIKENRYWGLNSDLIEAGFKKNTVNDALKFDKAGTRLRRKVIDKAYNLVLDYNGGNLK